MADLETALFKLKKVHGDFLLPGVFDRNSDLDDCWPSDLPRSSETDLFFTNHEPRGVRFETGFTPMNFFEVAKLKKAQLGYRWTQGPENTKSVATWPGQFLVLMDGSGGGKPIIADTSTTGTPVYAAYDVVVPFKIADTLADYFLALAELIAVVYGEYDVFDIADEDDNILPEFSKTLEVNLIAILGKENFVRFFDYFYG